METTNLKNKIRDILADLNLDYNQKKHLLAYTAENILPYPEVSAHAQVCLDSKIICDLFEGAAPYRARYILPDYEKALRNGCKFLELSPPQNLDEAINFLTILYTYVPSVTGVTVFIGELDRLLLPFCKDISQTCLEKKLKLFLRSIDRLLPSAFVHANIGPEDNIVARTILKLERELKQVVPNLSLKYDPDITSDELMLEGIKTVFEVAKPYFVNDKMMQADLGPKYGVASCYNSLKIGGGSHTLVRLNLSKTTDNSTSISNYLTEVLPRYVKLMHEVMGARIKFLVEVTKFFDSCFLAEEGFINIDNFSAMFGIVGLAEAVNNLLGQQNAYGKDPAANELSIKILDTISEIINSTELPYCKGNNNHAFFHAQSGIDTDINVSPGARIPLGNEPELYNHIHIAGLNHKYFNSGTSDVFHFDQTAKDNPQAILDIIKGAFAQNMRMFTFNMADSEFVRITGYLVRKSDLAKFKEDGSRLTSTVYGYQTVERTDLSMRRVRKLSNENSAN